ncbi:MAG: hypothetical protein A2X92_01640 [Syntrophus sp. GWC2_56_31]|nr:MAG: hypothetical protein A2X92_01640 [Syntrophus sp. GWC2_56_31]
MKSTFTYDIEKKLTAPEGGVLAGINVIIEIDPPSAGCLIYGEDADGNITYVQVQGARSEIELPFREPKVFVKYLLGLEHIKIYTAGYTPKL